MTRDLPTLGSKPRYQWEAPIGLALVALFFLLGSPHVLFATLLQISLSHIFFVLITTAGLWVSFSGLYRGDLRNRLLSLPVLVFFLSAVVLLYLRGLS